MARERYLVGVDPEELKPVTHEEAPQTPRSKWENFWFYHKWKVIVGAFVLFALGVILWQLSTRTEPDYFIVIATRKQMTQNSIEMLRYDLEAAAEDINGDGKVYVRIANAYFESEREMGARTAAASTLMVHFASGDVLLYAFEPEYYQTYAVDGVAEGEFFAAELPEGQGLTADGRCWSWKESKICRSLMAFDDEMLHQGYDIYTPDDLWFCVRKATGTADMQEGLYERCMTFLAAYRAANETSDADLPPEE